MRRVLIHIDRLVLRGFSAEDRHGIGAGLRREMEQVFSDWQAVSQLRGMGDVSTLKVRGSPIEFGSTLHGVGEVVAKSIGKETWK